MTTDTRTVLDRLVAGGMLHNDNVRRLRRTSRERYDEIFAGDRRAIESQVTALMSMFAGDLEASTIKFFCTKTGRVYHDRMQIVPGHDFARNTGQKSRRRFDLVITDSAEVDGVGVWSAEIVIEAKFGGDVNAALGFCPNDPVNYSNQIICYPDGCINQKVDHRSGVSFVWLGDAPKRPDLGPWGTAGMHQGYVDLHDGDEDYAQALRRQDEIAHIWVGATWAELGRWLSSPDTGVSDPDLPSVLRFISAL